jgi:hypothetical protein
LKALALALHVIFQRLKQAIVNVTASDQLKILLAVVLFREHDPLACHDFHLIALAISWGGGRGTKFSHCELVSRESLRIMSDRSDEYRNAAAECIAMARNSTDPDTRLQLLTMAQKWLDLANGPQLDFDAILKAFNDRQMFGR